MKHKLSVFFKWVGQILALLLALVWGLFFLEHMAWFVEVDKPPLEIWLRQGVHFIMLIGLLLTLKHRLTGSLMAAGAAILFFSPFIPYQDGITYIVITSLPAICFGLAFWLGRTTKKGRA